MPQIDSVVRPIEENTAMTKPYADTAITALNEIVEMPICSLRNHYDSSTNPTEKQGNIFFFARLSFAFLQNIASIPCSQKQPLLSSSSINSSRSGTI